MADHSDPSMMMVLAERLRRQHLTGPLTDQDAYLSLFAQLQPVAPIYNGRPGDPPHLAHRTRFDDAQIVDHLRARRMIVKGRFQGGTVGYVLASKLEQYALTFRRQLDKISPVQLQVLDVVRQLGPLSAQQIKEETGILGKKIMPALHRLQGACLVYEDQADSDWDRAWYDLAIEWPDLELDESAWESAASHVILRVLRANVFATAEELKDWSKLPAKRLNELLSGLERGHAIAPLTVDGLGDGWICADEPPLQLARPPRSVFMLHKGDPLVRLHASDLKHRFGELETLQYLLIDGMFCGAVCGHWRISPHDVDDVVVELSEPERAHRREDILAVVATVYRAPVSHILQYDGEAIKPAA